MRGLSPHGRGKRAGTAGTGIRVGSIPARAGETGRDIRADYWYRVYPRTGGGNRFLYPQGRRGRGLSPHGRGKRLGVSLDAKDQGSIPARAGETSWSRTPKPTAVVYPRTGGGNLKTLYRNRRRQGLSPHGRGKRLLLTFGDRIIGSIPARAGETETAREVAQNGEVYPRTGGGNSCGR